MTDQEIKMAQVIAIPAACVLITITICIWHYWHNVHIREHTEAMRQKEIDAAQEAKDKEARQAYDLKRMELDHATGVQKIAGLRDEIMRDLATKHAYYCPGCGKVMTLQHVARLPAEAQAQMMYVPPSDPEEEDEPEKKKRKRG